MKRTLDLSISAALLAIAAALFAATFSDQFDVPTFGGDIGPAAVPRAFLIVWMALSAAVMFIALRSDDRSRISANIPKLLAVAAIVCGTGLAVMTVGFVFAAIPGFFLFCWAFGYRRPVLLAVLSVAGPLLIWALFTYGFELLLPRSPWFHMI